MRNPQRSQQEWRQLFKQQQHSGLSVARRQDLKNITIDFKSRLFTCCELHAE